MNRTITTTSITRRRRSLRHAALALCAVLVALVAASCTADALDGTDTGAPSGNGNPEADVLTFAVSPRPGFTEAAATRGTNTKAVIPGLTRDLPNQSTAPATRAELTDDATRWETGDILWLDVRFLPDKQNSNTLVTYCISALKYDVDKWRYLTEAEAEAFDDGSIPNFSRLVRLPRGWKEWVDPGMLIYAVYVGSGKPGADGKLTINPAGEIPTRLFISVLTTCSLDGKPVPLKLAHRRSRVRIPAGYKVELTNTLYLSGIEFLPNGIFPFNNEITEIPEQSKDTDVFLELFINSTAKLTRNGVSYTFTFPRITDADGNLTHDDASYTLTPYTSGTETPGDYDLTVATEDDLRYLAQAVNAGEKLPNGKPAAEARVLQTANIHLTQGEWVPIGNSLNYACQFRGAYNGNGHEITGLTITSATQPDANNESYAGLFGRAEGAVLTGIKLQEVKINILQGSGEDYLRVGSIAGFIRNSTLSLCSAAGTVNAGGDVQNISTGGIAGYSIDCTISRCRADVGTRAATTNANGYVYAGGIVGYNTMCILSCEAQGGVVTAYGGKYAYAGGINGYSISDTFIGFCRTSGTTVTAQNATEINSAGGLAGFTLGSLCSCYSLATAKVIADAGDKWVGAIVGRNNWGDVQYCYATGTPGQGTSNLGAADGNIVYETNPGPGEIFRVMTGYTGLVEFVDNEYFYTTHYDAATFTYGINLQRGVWKSDGAWNEGDGKYPGLNIEAYEGK